MPGSKWFSLAWTAAPAPGWSDATGNTKVPGRSGPRSLVGVGCVVALLLAAAGPPVFAGWAPDGSPVCGAAGNQTDPILIGSGTAVSNDYRDARSGIYFAGAGSTAFPYGTTPTGSPVYSGTGEASAPRAIPFPSSILVTWGDTRNGSGNADVFVQRVSGSGVWPSFIWDGIQVCTAPRDQVDPSITDDGTGGFFVAWSDARNDSTAGMDIYLQHYYEYGQPWEGWPANGIRVCGAPGDQLEPVVLSDGSGGAVITWRDRRTGQSDFYAKAVAPDGGTLTGWGAEGNPICDAPGEQMQHRVLPDGTGGAYLTWIDHRDGTPQVYADRVSNTGAPAPGWPSNGLAISNDPREFVEAAALCPADSGGVYVAWTHYGKASSAVSAQRLLADGSSPSGWFFGGREVSRSVVFGTGLAAMPDGAGGVFVAWDDYGSMADIRALRLLGNGNVAAYWPAGGVVLTGATGDQLVPLWRSGQSPGGPIVPDGSGGGIVAWTDARNPANLDIYAQRVTKHGVVAPSRPPGCWIECNPDFVQRVFPNPTRGEFSVEAWVPEEGGAWVDVFDVAGRVRYKRHYDEPGPIVHELPVTLPPLPAGIYLLRYRLGTNMSGRGYGLRKITLVH